jgi:hypothetical protein
MPANLDHLGVRQRERHDSSRGWAPNDGDGGSFARFGEITPAEAEQGGFGAIANKPSAIDFDPVQMPYCQSTGAAKGTPQYTNCSTDGNSAARKQPQ